MEFARDSIAFRRLVNVQSLCAAWLASVFYDGVGGSISVVASSPATASEAALAAGRHRPRDSDRAPTSVSCFAPLDL